MAYDYSRLKSTLANSRVQADNNALYQTILGLINGALEFQSGIQNNTAAINNITSVIVTGGDVIGPAVAVDSDIALFSGTSGKIIKDGGTISTLLDAL